MNAPRPDIDWAALYDDHPEYVARRGAGSFEQAQVDLEVQLFKLPGLLGVLPDGIVPPLAKDGLKRVLEIGCATGELIAAFPATERVGLDISPANIAAARARYPQLAFACGDFRTAGLAGFDAVVMSDVLEHVPDDVGFLRDAARLGRIVLVNLPLEDNWLNDRRVYGPDDVSGHLRRYTIADGLALFERAGLEVLKHTRVWVHETPTEAGRRALRRARFGAAYTGALPVRALKHLVVASATAVPPLGRRLFASNLFASARLRETGT